VGEGLDAAGRLRQKGLAGARARRRGLADGALAEIRQQLRSKTTWHGSELVEADRCFPSRGRVAVAARSRTSVGPSVGTCDGGGARHRRDDHAAINLARYRSPGDSTRPASWGPGKTRASRARGEEARTPQGEPREGCHMRLSLTQRQRKEPGGRHGGEGSSHGQEDASS